jgi:general secretion pathway protein F
MKTFYFRAINREGKRIEDSRSAADQPSLLLLLQNEGLFPEEISENAPRNFRWGPDQFKRQRLSDKQILLLTRELHTLLESGLALDKALLIMTDLTQSDQRLSAVIANILQRIKDGAQLSEALTAQEDSFSPFYINLVRAGEAGGSLTQVLARLTRYLENSKELKDTVSTSMMYPIILLIMAIGSLLLLLAFVVPQFSEMFESAGKELPVPTQIVVGLAEVVRSYWWLIPIAFFAAQSVLLRMKADSKRRSHWDARLLKLPLIGELLLKLQVASFCRTLATLLENGVNLLTGLGIAQATVSNQFIKEKLGIASQNLKGGGSLSQPLEEAHVFPVLTIQMIKIGEESGQLAEMLDRIATIYDKDIKISVQRILALLEPIMIVSLGLIIGGIIVSILMAILSINDLAV